MAESKRPEVGGELCALVYQYGRLGGRFEMPVYQMHKKIDLREAEVEGGLDHAESWGWVRRTPSRVALTAAGIFVAKRVLGLLSNGEA